MTIRRVSVVVARWLCAVVLLFFGFVVTTLAIGAAGFDRDGPEDTCFDRLRPPPGAGVSVGAVARVDVDWQWLPLGVRCGYAGPSGGSVVVSDIKVVHTLALATGMLLAVSAVGIVITTHTRRDTVPPAERSGWSSRAA